MWQEKSRVDLKHTCSFNGSCAFEILPTGRLPTEFHFRHLTRRLSSTQSLFRGYLLFNTSEMPKINLSAISFHWLSLLLQGFLGVKKTLINISVYWVRYNGRKNHNTREAFATKVTSTRKIRFLLKKFCSFVSWTLMKQMCFSFRERDVLYRRFEHPPNSLRENVFSFFTLRISFVC